MPHPLERWTALWTALLLALTLGTGPAGGATLWIDTFEQDFFNWANAHDGVFQFPPRQPWDRIELHYTIECPGAPDDCDPWDRLGHVRVVQDDGQGGEILTEIARIITPYDITGGSRPGSCTWVLDVTDYQSLLHDTVTLRSYIESWIGGTRGWLVTIRFAFITGSGPTEPYRVVNLWTNDRLIFGDPSDPIESHLAPVQVSIDSDAVAARVRATTTGHGQGNTNNAAEFSNKWHEITVGSDSYVHQLWRSDCAANSCSPQGGTWTYARAGWCPGDKVDPWNVDVTASVTAGQTATIDYNVEPYENFCRPNNPACVSGSTCNDCNYNSNGHTEPHYTLQTQLVLYRPARTENIMLGEGPGPTSTNRVRVLGPSGVAADFQAYGAGSWGTQVASADIDGGDHWEVLTGPGPGAVYGPQLRAFFRDGSGVAKVNFYAYGTLKFGVVPAAAELDADGYAEILSGAGPGEVFGPHVRGWNFDGDRIAPMGKINFFAYQTLKYGVNVADGDLEGDFYGELLTGPGPGPIFGPQIRGWNFDAATLTAIQKINFGPAYPATEYGARVAGGDVDGDFVDEIVVVPGPSPQLGAQAVGFDFDGGPIAPLPGYDLTPWTSLYGGTLALGDLDSSWLADLLIAEGPDPAGGSAVEAYAYDGSSLTTMGISIAQFPGAAYGTNLGAGRLGY